MGLQAIFHANYLRLVKWFEFENPGAVFDLVKVVEFWIVKGAIQPHPVNDFDPTLAQATQAVGMTVTFIAMVAVVDFGPRTAGTGLLGKQVHCMTQVFVTGPSLMAGPARRIGSGFTGAAGHRSGARQALQSLHLSVKAIPVIADFRQQTRGQLRSGAR